MCRQNTAGPSGRSTTGATARAVDPPMASSETTQEPDPAAPARRAPDTEVCIRTELELVDDVDESGERRICTRARVPERTSMQVARVRNLFSRFVALDAAGDSR
jgi:hypothetical protein